MTDDCLLPDDLENLEELICRSLTRMASPFESFKLIRIVLKGLREITGSARADLLLYQDDMNVLFFSETIAAGAPDKHESQISIAGSKNSAPVEALAGGHTVLVEDVRNSAVLSLSQGSRTLLAIPIVYGEHVHGVLNMEHALPDAYDSDTVRWAEAAATLLSVLLEHSFLEERLFHANQQLIDRMTKAASETDPGFRAHAERVSLIAVAIASQLGLSDDLVHAVRDSGYLHDVGKSGVSRNILVKPGNLTDDEFKEVRRHPILGRFLLKPLGFKPAVIEGVANHHERWDGNGYPRGIAGEEIPITGRILAVAEAFDVMTSDQPYRSKLSEKEALEEIRNKAGSQFDPKVVDALTQIDVSELEKA